MSSAGGPRPHEWVLPAAFPWAPASSLPTGAAVAACYTIVEVTQGGSGTAVVELLLSDARERVIAVLDAPAGPVMAWLRAGLTVGVRGTVLSADEPRILVREIAPVQPALEDLPLLIPGSRRPADVMDGELTAWVDSVRDDALRQLLGDLLGADTETGRAFRLAPAAMRHHHAFLGGLLEHTLSVTAICDALARHYGAVVDRDLLIAGALLHDIGKVLEIGARAGFPYTDDGRLLGHVLLGLRLVAEAARAVDGLAPRRLLLLEHCIAAHQGRYEWQSPREPLIIEALLLHHADDLDAKAGAALDQLESVAAGWSRGHRPGRDWLRHGPPGVDAVADTRGVAASPATASAAGPEKPRRGRTKGHASGRRKRAGRRRRGGRRKRGAAARQPSPATNRRSPRRGSGDGGEPGAGQAAFSLPMDPDTIDLFDGAPG